MVDRLWSAKPELLETSDHIYATSRLHSAIGHAAATSINGSKFRVFNKIGTKRKRRHSRRCVRLVASYKVSVADGSAQVLRLVSRDLDFQYRSLMAAQPAA
jgi:hypothetical protein